MMNNFKLEVAQNRPRLALVELIAVIESLESRITSLEEQFSAKPTHNVSQSPPIEKTEAVKDSPPPVKKRVAKKVTPAKKEATAN